MATATESSSSSSDGPVLSVISKRIRALRKKYNRIVQMEEALASGKALNKEQEEVLKSKPVVTALIDELEKLRSPLAAAVTEELQQQHQPQQQSEEQKRKQSDRSAATADQDELIEDLLRLVYFGSLFDVRSQAEFTAMMLTRSHERGCCLTYDYVTDDVVDLLSEKDLNLISVLGSLVTSRPVNEVISHKSALEACIDHAKRWISGSDQPINPETAATYAGLKEKLKKIISSDFFTATPEMKAPVEVAAAVGQLHISEGSTVQSETAEGDIADPDNNKEEQENSQSSESYTEHPSGAPDEPAKTDEVNDTVPRDLPPVHSEQQDIGEADTVDQVHADSVPKDQQQAVGGGRRSSYPNGRGGGGGGRGGGGRRPYPNGRGGGGRGNGGRGGGGGGGYANGGHGGHGGWGGYYYDSNYQPRGYYNNRGGRGGGGGRSGGNGGSMYNRQGGGGSNGGHAAVPS